MKRINGSELLEALMERVHMHAATPHDATVSLLASMELVADRLNQARVVPERNAPVLTGEHVKAAWCNEFQPTHGDVLPKVYRGDTYNDRDIATAWDRVAARLSKP